MTNQTALKERRCIPCEGGIPPLDKNAQQDLLKQLSAGWQVIDGHHLEKEFKFKNFVQALNFTNAVGAVAEAEGHHPDIFLTWGKVKLTIWTHSINGLTESDFILAAKAEAALPAA